MRLGFAEIVLILVIALVVFGPSKLPQLGDALGKGIRNFKKATLDPDPDEADQEKAEQARLGSGSPAAGAASTPAHAEAKKV
jgi:sec-independent protein translocase protein TatA